MSVRRTVELVCEAPLAAALADAIGAYAHAAFPLGGSECAQASREALLRVADTCRGHQGGPLSVRKRQLAQLRAAVKWYASESGRLDADTARRLADLLA